MELLEFLDIVFILLVGISLILIPILTDKIISKYDFTLEDGTVLKGCSIDYGSSGCYGIKCPNGVVYQCQKNFKQVRINRYCDE